MRAGAPAPSPAPAGDADPSSRGESSGGGPSRPRRFPGAAQPEIMRAAEKDDSYAAHVTEACRDAFRHLFGTRVAVAYQNEIKLLGQSLYYLLTTGSGQQTLGEEYCDISQVATSHGLPPTPARRILFILYQTTVPYLAERISSRIVARGIALNDAQLDDHHAESDNSSRDAASQSSPIRDNPSRSLSFSYLSRLRGKVHALWQFVLQKWPLILPFSQDFIQLAIRTNLMFFYFEGLYYHLPKRAAGIRYVFIGKPMNQRPRYQILGIFLLIQLCILGAERLRRSNLSTIASSINQISSGSYPSSRGRGVPILNEDGNIISDIRHGKTIDQASGSEASSGKSKCTLCLGTRQNPTATTCGHVFCWSCIMEWCNEKPECPLCRTPITHSSLICIYHSDF
ncbi:hypothetical protein GUJ93_ZPchr0007g5902 [Zizania palustris]|uniref:RING-type E3 ubiquitin transferase n=1 Tax=Zizania palustris TaxID=103762 RepID=A0A8J5T4L6_ZIZPA|nr:hypothetical protein GUJ93_ZPchr0007g5902 [Zizania palustris]